MASFGLTLMFTVAWVFGVSVVMSMAKEHFGGNADGVAMFGCLFLTGLAFYVFG